jgi:hypothetical protein
MTPDASTDVQPDPCLATKPCQHAGCDHPGIPCVLASGDGTFDNPDQWLCPGHASEAGYCPGCGWFSAGTGHPFDDLGWCDNCLAELDDDDDDEDDDDSDFDDEDDEDLDDAELDEAPDPEDACRVADHANRD